MKHFRVILFFALAACLFAASPTIINRDAKWPPQTGTAYTFGGPFEFISQDVPTSSTTVGSVATHHIIGMWLHNATGGSSITLTFKDKQASAQPLPYDGVVITAGQDLFFNAPSGILASGGMTIQASGAGLTYQIQFTN